MNSRAAECPKTDKMSFEQHNVFNFSIIIEHFSIVFTSSGLDVQLYVQNYVPIPTNFGIISIKTTNTLRRQSQAS